MIITEQPRAGVHVITLSNGKVNALCMQLLHELQEASAGIADSRPRAVVITGGPDVFAAGADVTEFAERGGEAPFQLAGSDQVTRIGQAFAGALGAVSSLPCPTIAAINGFALGGGCELALACDFRVASDGARLGQPEILLGIIPGGGATQRLARLVGPAAAKDLIFTGRTVDADEALAIGLVDRLVTGDGDASGTPGVGDAIAAALEIAAEYLGRPREALALAKQAIDGGLDGTLHDGLALERRLFVSALQMNDARVGVESYLRDGPGSAEFD